MRTITRKFPRESIEFHCPECGGSYFGAIVDGGHRITGYACHDQYNERCRMKGPKDVMFAKFITELTEPRTELSP